MGRHSSCLPRVLVALSVGLAPSHGAGAPPAVSRQPPAAEPSEQVQVVDVALHDDGMLIGQLVDASGKPTSGAKVRVGTADGREAEAITNADGGFAFKEVRGVVRLESDSAQLVARCWTAEAAPPSSAPAVLLVARGDVARGQRYVGQGTQGFVTHTKRLFANPLFVAGVVGTAVAIPVAIHNADDDDPAS